MVVVVMVLVRGYGGRAAGGHLREEYGAIVPVWCHGPSMVPQDYGDGVFPYDSPFLANFLLVGSIFSFL